MKLNPMQFAARFLLLVLALVLSSCASLPAPIPKKVQTYEELFLKLKEGFDLELLMKPEFYAKELGYPLKDLPRYRTVNEEKFGHEQRIEFDQGQLKGTSLYVQSEAVVNPKTEILRTVFKVSKDFCYTRAQFEELWKTYPGDRQWSVYTPHIQTMGKTPVMTTSSWSLSKKNQPHTFHTSFVFNIDIGCLLQVTTASVQIKE